MRKEMFRDHNHHDHRLPILVGALRSTLRRLEEREELAPDDPALKEIKRSILRAIVSREIESSEEAAA